MTAARKLLRDAVGLEFLNTTPRGADFDRLVDLVIEVLDPKLHRQTVADSIQNLAGTPLDDKLIDDTAWRLAGNLKRLRQRRAVPPWHGQKLPEWVPVQVVSCRRSKSKKYQSGATVGFRVMAGTPCPRIVLKWWSLKQCRFYSTDFGWSKPGGGKSGPPRYPYSAPEQLVGLRCHVLITPDESTTEPGFLVPRFPAEVAAWNSDMIKRRLRSGPTYRCPAGLPDSFPCQKCPRGYTTCKAGTHRLDWVERPCPVCGKQDAYFDPEGAADQCVDCFAQNVYKKTT